MSAADTIQNADLIVIKIGSVLIRDPETETVREDWFAALAEDIHALAQTGKKIVIVSSGAVALGRKALGISYDTPPSSIPLEQKQAASAVGQFHMFAAYHKALSAHSLQCAQVLLTMSETENRRMHLNARETLSTLLEHNIIPVINENDTVSTGEIRFGDNDRLAVRVGLMIDADAVILLSTTDGLYTDDPGKNKDAAHLPVIEEITDAHIKMAGEAIPGLSTGGMKSKLEAAISATRAGMPLIIASGMADHCLKNLSDEQTTRSTLFQAQPTQKNARKTWIHGHLSPKGKVYVDDGAASALKKGTSLLPIGVKKIEGSFERGDIIDICSMDGAQIGKGLSAYHVNDAQKIIGRQSHEIPEILGYIRHEELIHRNDMVLQD